VLFFLKKINKIPHPPPNYFFEKRNMSFEERVRRVASKRAATKCGKEMRLRREEALESAKKEKEAIEKFLNFKKKRTSFIRTPLAMFYSRF